MCPAVGSTAGPPLRTAFVLFSVSYSVRTGRTYLGRHNRQRLTKLPNASQPSTSVSQSPLAVGSRQRAPSAALPSYFWSNQHENLESATGPWDLP